MFLHESNVKASGAFRPRCFEVQPSRQASFQDLRYQAAERHRPCWVQAAQGCIEISRLQAARCSARLWPARRRSIISAYSFADLTGGCPFAGRSRRKVPPGSSAAVGVGRRWGGRYAARPCGR
jgi:hypothetical protein